MNDNTEENKQQTTEIVREEAREILSGIFQARQALSRLWQYSDDFSKSDKEMLYNEIEVALNSLEELTADLESTVEDVCGKDRRYD